MENKLFFRAELGKQGNDFLVKVPGNLAEQLGLKEKDIVGITIGKPDNVELPHALAEVYRKYVPELKQLNDSQISKMVDLLNREKVSTSANVSAELKQLGLVDSYKKLKEKLQGVDKDAMKKDLEAAVKNLKA